MKCLFLSTFFSIFSILVIAQDKVFHVNSMEIIREGIALHDKEKYKDAIAKYKQVPDNDTNNILAFYEIALSARIDSQYALAKQYCQKGLALSPSAYEHDLLIEMGNVYDTEDKYDSATIYFNKAIERYPKSYLAYHAKGINMFLKKDYDSAVYFFQKVLLMNPYAFNSHYYLGVIAKERGYPIQAMMSFAMNLITSPANPRFNLTIQNLYSLSTLADTVVNKYNNRKTEKYFNEDYADLEVLFKSKIAFEKGYEVKASFNETFIKQLHLIIEKLPETYDNKEFWNAFYSPVYKEIFKNKLFDEMILRMISNIDNAAIQKKVKQEAGGIQKMYAIVDDNIGKIGYYGTIDKKEFTKEIPGYIFEENKPIAIGKLINNDKKNLEGEWIFLNVLGEKSTVINFKKGKYNGNYKSYYYTGQLKEEYNYLDDKLSGDVTEYYINGVQKATAVMLNGKHNGVYKQYYKNGNLSSIETFTNGIKNGLAKSFHQNGAAQYEYDNVNDLIDGSIKEYYQNDKLKSTTECKKGKANGQYIAYHLNGVVEEKGMMEDGNKEGEFLGYDSEGKLSAKLNYKKNKLNGECTYYYPSGTISRKAIYNNGEADGEFIDYAENGNMSAKTDYKNGRIKKVIFQNVITKQLINETAVTDKNKNNLKIYNDIGCLKKDIICDRDGMFNGENTTYFIDGKKESISNWDKGLQTGKETTYYKNGQIASEYLYEIDVLNGNYQLFHFNGKLKEEGTYVEGKRQGICNSYNNLGNLIEKDFFVNDEFHGPQYYYFANGKINKTIDYKFGEETKIIQFDTTGKAINTIEIKPNFANQITELNPLGKIERKYTFKNNHLEGIDEGFYPNGKTSHKTYQYKGLLDSNYITYYSNGVKQKEGNYSYNYQNGTWKNYERDGKIASILHYKNNDSHGIDSFYNEDGTFDIAIPYKDDSRHGILKKYASTGELMYIYNYLDGLLISYSYEKPDGTLMPEIAIENSAKLEMIKTFYKNGNVSSEGGYQNGDYQGKRMLYFPNGKPEYEVTYNYSLRQGELKEYHPNGNLKYIQNFINGEQQGPQKYYSDNNILIKEENFKDGYMHGPSKYYDNKGTLLQTITYYWGHDLTIE